MQTLSFQNIIELLIRCLGIPRRAFGTVTIKLQRGEPKHVTFEESFDLESLKGSELTLQDNKMFTKFGAKNNKDPESSTMISEVEIDEDNKITKESKLKKEKKEEETIKEDA